MTNNKKRVQTGLDQIFKEESKRNVQAAMPTVDAVAERLTMMQQQLPIGIGELEARLIVWPGGRWAIGVEDARKPNTPKAGGAGAVAGAICSSAHLLNFNTYNRQKFAEKLIADILSYTSGKTKLS